MPKDTIVEAVVEELRRRSEVGYNKYSTTLDRTDLSTLEWVRHAKEEAMDLALYLTRLERDLTNGNTTL